MPRATNFVIFLQVRLVEKLDPHHEVLVEEGTGILLVEADAPDLRGEVDDDIGPLLIIEPADVLRPYEIVIGQIGDEDVVIAVRLKGLDEVFPQKTLSAGDGDAFVLHHMTQTIRRLPQV